MGITYSLHYKKNLSNLTGVGGEGSLSGESGPSLRRFSQECVDVFFDLHKDWITPILNTRYKKESLSEDVLCSAGVNYVHQQDSSKSSRSSQHSAEKNCKFFRWNKLEVEANSALCRYAHTMVAIGSNLYLFGGFASGRYLSDVYIFDSVNKLWKEAKTSGTQPPPRAFHSAWVYKNKMYIYAGFNGRYVLDDFYSLDTETLLWSKENPGGTLPNPRFEHATSIVGEELYLFGGANEITWLSDVYILNMETMVWRNVTTTGDSPSNRCAHSLIGFGDRYLILFGGFNGSYRLNDMYVLDCVRQRWIQVSRQNNRIAGKAAHAASAHNDNLLLIGGSNGRDSLMDITVFDSKLMEWSHSFVIGEPPQPRSYHSATLINNCIYIFGGHSETHNLNDICCLEPITPSLTDLCIYNILKSPNHINLKQFPEDLKRLFKDRKFLKNLYYH